MVHEWRHRRAPRQTGVGSSGTGDNPMRRLVRSDARPETPAAGAVVVATVAEPAGWTELPAPLPIAAPARRFGRGRLDAHARALVKAISWRAIGTLDTFLWSLLITHRAEAAGAIASIEVLTKCLLFYLHERGWRLVRWRPNSHARSLAKAISWRFVGSLDTFVLSLLVTGSARYAVSIASAEAISKILLFYGHERVWRRVAWGRLEG
jgi:uncharacterized membrane protein